MIKPALDHVALLVKNIDTTLSTWRLKSSNSFDEFVDIGTKELYVGPSSTCQNLLLMQAIGPGPYQRAFEKRGEGLHHLAFNVADLEKFMGTVEGSGWLLHPKSLSFYQSMKQVYLCRPGVPMFIELIEADAPSGAKYIDNAVIPVPSEFRRLFDIFDTTGIEFSDENVTLQIEGHFCGFP